MKRFQYEYGIEKISEIIYQLRSANTKATIFQYLHIIRNETIIL